MKTKLRHENIWNLWEPRSSHVVLDFYLFWVSLNLHLYVMCVDSGPIYTSIVAACELCSKSYLLDASLPLCHHVSLLAFWLERTQSFDQNAIGDRLFEGFPLNGFSDRCQSRLGQHKKDGKHQKNQQNFHLDRQETSTELNRGALVNEFIWIGKLLNLLISSHQIKNHSIEVTLYHNQGWCHKCFILKISTDTSQIRWTRKKQNRQRADRDLISVRHFLIAESSKTRADIFPFKLKALSHSWVVIKRLSHTFYSENFH